MRDPDKNVEFITVKSRYRLLIIIKKEWQLTLDDFCYFSSLKTKGNNSQGSPQLLQRVTHIKDLFRKCKDWIYFSIIQNFEVFTRLLISIISRALLKCFNRVDSKSDLTPVKNNINWHVEFSKISWQKTEQHWSTTIISNIQFPVVNCFFFFAFLMFLFWET